MQIQTLKSNRCNSFNKPKAIPPKVDSSKVNATRSKATVAHSISMMLMIMIHRRFLGYRSGITIRSASSFPIHKSAEISYRTFSSKSMSLSQWPPRVYPRAAAFSVSTSPSSSTELWLSDNSIEIDAEGRYIRRRSTTDNDNQNDKSQANINESNNMDKRRSSSSWDNFDPTNQQSSMRTDEYQQQKKIPTPRYGRGGWVDDKEGWDDNDTTERTKTPRQQRPIGRTSNSRNLPRRNNINTNNNSNRSYQRSGANHDNTWARDRSSFHRERSNTKSTNKDGNKKYESDTIEKNRINIRHIENSGYDHLYGLSSIVNALQANVRFKSKSGSVATYNDDDDSWYANESQTSDDDNGDPNIETNTEVKPEAHVGTFLFVQDTYNSGISGSRRSNDKQQLAQQVMSLAEQYEIPIVFVNKGILNTLSNNRPHQGYVLRCPKLDTSHMLPLSTIPVDTKDPNYKPFWLVLDEVVDPQNFGAILRSAYFLGGASTDSATSSKSTMGVLICSKNSAPPSAVASATSAGALELLMIRSPSSSQLYSTSHLIRLLANAEQNGCRIIGASSSVPSDNVVPLYNLQDIPPIKGSAEVTILILGSEGHGLRPLVAKSCTEFVRIPSSTSSLSEDNASHSISNNVDSLNVSVTAGILLWHFLKQHTNNSNQ